MFAKYRTLFQILAVTLFSVVVLVAIFGCIPAQAQQVKWKGFDNIIFTNAVYVEYNRKLDVRIQSCNLYQPKMSITDQVTARYIADNSRHLKADI